MKKILLFLMCNAIMIIAFSQTQCTPNPLYQDSTYKIWPDTLVGLPWATQGVPYSAVLDIKTPATLIEASGGDSSLTTIDTLSQTFYIGGWPVDSMSLVSVSGLPAGLNFGCYISNCVLPGDFLSCAWVEGVVDAGVADGIYPIEILVDVFTHGDISYQPSPILPPIIIPVETSLYEALGSYEEVPGYKIVVSQGGQTSLYYEENITSYILKQNYPNPCNEYFNVEFFAPQKEEILFSITDVLGKVLYYEYINTNVGLNKVSLNHNFKGGMYFYSIKNENISITKRMIVSE